MLAWQKNYDRVTDMKTDPTFNSLVSSTFTQINDQVFCSLIDIGVTPGDAYQISYIDIPFEETHVEPYQFSNLLEDVDDVVLIDL